MGHYLARYSMRKGLWAQINVGATLYFTLSWSFTVYLSIIKALRNPAARQRNTQPAFPRASQLAFTLFV